MATEKVQRRKSRVVSLLLEAALDGEEEMETDLGEEEELAGEKAKRMVKGIYLFTAMGADSGSVLAMQMAKARVKGVDMEIVIGICEITRRSYRVTLSDDDFTVLAARDDIENDLDVILNSFCATNVDQNGHFGPNVFFDISEEDDTPSQRKAIEQAIAHYVKEAYATSKP